MLFNDPKTFREDMLKGYVAAYPDYVVEVPGGVARATKMPEGKKLLLSMVVAQVTIQHSAASSATALWMQRLLVTYLRLLQLKMCSV